METEKKCPKCKEMKAFSAFSKSAKAADGLCIWCKTCSSKQQKDWRERNAVQLRERARDNYQKNKAAISQKQAEYRLKNKAFISKLNAERYKKNPQFFNEKTSRYMASHPEKAREYARAWRLRNKHMINAKSSWRRSQLRMATPEWANKEAIVRVFLEAEKMRLETGVPHDVDHIVPIKSPMLQSLDAGNIHPKKTFVGPLIPIVQGFHCEANLRVIPEIQNRLKSNIVWPDMPSVHI